MPEAAFSSLTSAKTGSMPLEKGMARHSFFSHTASVTETLYPFVMDKNVALSKIFPPHSEQRLSGLDADWKVSVSDPVLENISSLETL